MKTNRPGFLPAFTILEMTIALLLSAVVILIAYSAFRINQYSFRRFLSGNKATQAMMTANYLLNLDLAKANSVYRDDEGIRCLVDSAEISYSFGQGLFIRREANSVDTLLSGLSDLNITFESRPAEPGGPVDSVRVKTLCQGRTVWLIAGKQYSAQQLMTLNDAVN